MSDFGRHIVSHCMSVPLRVRCISPIFLEVGIPNFVFMHLGMTKCGIPLLGHVTFLGHWDVDL